MRLDVALGQSLFHRAGPAQNSPDGIHVQVTIVHLMASHIDLDHIIPYLTNARLDPGEVQGHPGRRLSMMLDGVQKAHCIIQSSKTIDNVALALEAVNICDVCWCD